MSNYAIDANYPTRLKGYDFQWVDGKLVDTNNMQDPYVANSLLSRQAQTGPTEGLAVSDYVNTEGSNAYSPYLKFSNDSTVQGPVAGSNIEQKYDFSGVGGDTDNESIGDMFSRWFTPTGDKGTSLGGNVVGAIGTGVNALTGLAGMYYAKKNFDLQKEQADYLKNREAKFDAAKERLATNIGNGASYLADRGQ